MSKTWSVTNLWFPPRATCELWWATCWNMGLCFTLSMQSKLSSKPTLAICCQTKQQQKFPHSHKNKQKTDSTANPRMNELRHLECELHQFRHEVHEILVPHVVEESQQELVARLEEDRRGLNHAMFPPPSRRQHAGLCYIHDCCTDHYVVGQADAEDWEDVGHHAGFQQSPEQGEEDRHGEICPRWTVLVVPGKHSAWRGQVKKKIHASELHWTLQWLWEFFCLIINMNFSVF